MTGALLPLLVAAPVLGAGVLVGVRLGAGTRRAVLVGMLVAQLVASVLLLAHVAGGAVLAHRIGGWPQAIAIPFVADAFTGLMLVLTTTMTLAVCLFGASAGTVDEPFFTPLVLVVTAGVNGVLLTGDLFSLFVFVEIMLLPSYGLLILAHRGLGMRMQVTATRIYASVNLLTSTILLVGIAVVYAVLGTVNLGELAGQAASSPAARPGCSIVLLALGVKAAVVPTHGWLTRTYPNMSPTVTALFSGLHTKVALYAIFRWYAVVFDGGDSWRWLALTICVVSMVVGVLGALGQEDARSILTFSSVSQIGYILLGLAIFTPAAVTAAVFYLTYHTVTKTSLFLSIGAVELTYGRHRLGAVTGLLRREPWAAVSFFAAALSLAGIPPFSGFVAKLALIVAAFGAGQIAAAVTALAVSLFTLMSMLKIWGAMFLGEPSVQEWAEGERISRRLVAPAAALAVGALALGLLGQPLLALADTIATGLLEPAAYLAAVLGAPGTGAR